MSRRQFLALILPLLAVLLGFVVMSLLERTGTVGSPPWDDGFARYVRTTLAYEFVGGVEDDRVAWEAYFSGLNAYVRYFDDYAEVVPPWHLDKRREESSGQYVGIGVRVENPTQFEGDAVLLTGVKPGGPADKAGLKVGEAITAVGGVAVTELSPTGEFEPVGDKIRGEQGSTVRLRVRAKDGVSRDVDVVRDEVDTGSVFGARFVDEDARIGYLRVHAFMLDTSDSFRKKLQALLDKGMKALVLDLRDNGGGILPQAVAVADAFLDAGIIVRVRGRDEEFTDTLDATPAGTVSAGLPLAVLVSAYSASASEILAGALQDHRRAALVGQHTWGKFLVQTVEEVPMEQGTAQFKRTSAIYETPMGHNYQRRPRHRHRPDVLAGLVPDLQVSISESDEKTLAEIFDHDRYADWNPDRARIHTDFDDEALRAAIAILKGETYYPRLPASK